MEPLTITAVMGLLASTATAIISLWRGIGKSHAEALFVKRLSSDREVVRRFSELRHKLQREEQDVSDVYTHYLPTLLSAVSTLPEAHRKRILEGLKQPSEVGRSNYVQKLVEESTSAAGQSA